MNSIVLLGIDFGSGGCKVTAINGTGVILGEASVEYTTHYERQGWSEQDPDDWYPAMCEALAKVRNKGVDFSAIKAVSFDGSTHNAVLMDENMKPIRRTIMWTDQRSVKECIYLKENHLDTIFRTAYQMPSPTWTLPQMMWLKNNEPEILKKTNAAEIGVVMHCFSGSPEFAAECVKEGFYIALGGVTTFKNAKKAKEVAKTVPLDRLLLETDAPYMTPVPYRGKENQPAYVKFVAQEIANLRNISFEEVAKATTENAQRLLKI